MEETTKEWLESFNQDELTSQEAHQMMIELGKELAIAEAQPKPINEIAAAIEKAKEFKKNNPNAVPSTARTFNQQTYNDNDQIAKDIFSSYIKSKGHFIVSNEETYGIDIITSKDKKEFKFELEMSSVDFNETNYKYPYVHFLGRKKKMLTKEGDYWYVIISSNQEYALMAKASKIFQDDNYLVKYAGNGRDGVDEFYQLPMNQVKFFKISLTK